MPAHYHMMVTVVCLVVGLVGSQGGMTVAPLDSLCFGSLTSVGMALGMVAA